MRDNAELSHANFPHTEQSPELLLQQFVERPEMRAHKF